ncbi:MAG: histidinol-phosphate aminotransferase family protein [Gemmatimonadota bacterium]|nr:histidinol-phosphate aminotransferase family protein [Gemmatimonadota bacterium]MDE3126374.1 histidinol-phosphate aminotransferase family protein [Gemmatimonadota bacterium]MDE3171487.1 histidinol-phosphate aminotransferase family protein [Gemmatimonadota bacterium]MDE3214769.1 histidinol-phosphate aminotransferase family protein [Gemmatimonadota bacterium]
MNEPVRAVLRGAKPYATADVGAAVDLSDNTSLWGPPPAAVDALRALDASAFARYPAIPPAELYRALADYAGVSTDMIVAGCGSDDLIDGAMRTFAEPGSTIAFSTPTFSMVPAFAAINGLRAHAVPFRTDLDLDIDRLLEPRPSIVYLCSPNNPTASAAPLATIERVLDETPGVVILDEAYGEFTAAPGFGLLARHPRLVVLRTLSKAFGLAGLRIGYAVLDAALVPALETVRGPYKVNAAAVAAATAALTAGRDWVQARAAEAAGIRVRLAERLAAVGFSPLPSAANFLCVPCANAAAVAARVRDRGFALRVLRDLPPITPALAASRGAALRIAVGPWPVMARLLDELEPEAAACA